jgi:hypothetical protein
MNLDLGGMTLIGYGTEYLKKFTQANDSNNLTKLI